MGHYGPPDRYAAVLTSMHIGGDCEGFFAQECHEEILTNYVPRFECSSRLGIPKGCIDPALGK